MSKKIIIVIVVSIVLVLIIGGIFWGDKIANYLENKEMERIFVSSDNYNIQETSEGKFIKNKKDGLTVKIPEKWKIEKGTDVFGYVSDSITTTYSPDFNFRPAQGCAIEMEIICMKEKKEGFVMRGADELKEIIEYCKTVSYMEEEYHHQEIIYVNQREALKEILGNYIIVGIPTDNKVYSFTLFLFSEECSQEFDKFLETVVIQ